MEMMVLEDCKNGFCSTTKGRGNFFDKTNLKTAYDRFLSFENTVKVFFEKNGRRRSTRFFLRMRRTGEQWTQGGPRIEFDLQIAEFEAHSLVRR
jgi:hypothetical protein